MVNVGKKAQGKNIMPFREDFHYSDAVGIVIKYLNIQTIDISNVNVVI